MQLRGKLLQRVVRGAGMPIEKAGILTHVRNQQSSSLPSATKLRNLRANQAFFISPFDISATKRNTSVSGTPSALVAGIRLKHLKLMFSDC
jgi:hypothetical protein